MSHGADVALSQCSVTDTTGCERRRCLFTLASKSCAADRLSKSRLTVLRALLAAGVPGDVRDPVKQRSALHLAVNDSTDGADQALDLEMTLLRGGVDVHGADVRGRLPLHYAFVKIGRHGDSSRTDPIEVCSMLVDKMGGRGVDHRDAFGRSPLHYAARRGATVCCLLLLKHGAQV